MPTTGEELLSFATSVLPEYLAADIRDDARQQICLDLLSRTVLAGMLLNRRFVRRHYVNPAYALTSKFKFVSTDSPIHADSRCTVGERLVA